MRMCKVSIDKHHFVMNNATLFLGVLSGKE